jgi:hypothetical protein
MNLAWLKAHKYYVLGGLAGVLVLLYLMKRSANAATTPADLSNPGSSGVTSYDAAASLANANVNGQVEIAQVKAGVESQGIAASADVSKFTVASELAATENTNAANVAIALGKSADAVETQRIITSGQVESTAIVGRTIDTLGAQHADVEKQMLATVSAQVKQIQEHSKHASQDYAAIAPILAIESGQPAAAVGTANANAAGKVAAEGTKQAIIGGATSIIGDLTRGLFA